MASGSGAWSPTTGSGNRGRLTWDISQSPSSVGSGTGSVSLRLRVWYESRYSIVDSSNSYSITGSWSGSGSRSINHGGSGGRTVLYDGTITVSTSYAGTVKRSFTASFSGINATPNIPSVSGSHTVAKRPNRAPNPPTWGSTTRVGTDKCTITWSNNPTTAGPITRNEVQYWSSVNQDWRVNSNNVSATATSYTAQNLGTNREYRYRVRAVGPGGRSAWVTGGTIATPPSAPSNVSAQKLSGGAIRVSGTDTAGPTNRARTFLIYDSPDGGAEVLVGTVGSLPWTFADPDPSVTHAFRIRTRIDSQGEMLSPFSARTNTVQLLAPPNAPTLLAPAGVVDAGVPVTFRWRHNPVDTTDQTERQIWRRYAGETEWALVVQSSGDTTADSYTASIVYNKGTVEWRMRTKGAHPDWSPYSAVTVFTLASPPTVAINEPVGPVLEQSRVTLLLGYDHDEGSPQSRVQAELTQGGAVVETLSWAKGDSGMFRTDLDNNTTYTVRVRVQAGNGLWSEWDEVTFTTDFPTPVPRVVEGEWDRATGSVTVSSWADGVEGSFNWTGEPHESTSQRWEYDHLVATNLETDPTGVSGDGWGGASYHEPEYDAVFVPGGFGVDPFGVAPFGTPS